MRAWTIVAAVLLVGVAQAQSLSAAFDTFAERAELGPKARVGIVAIDIESGRVIGSRLASESFTPASNMKLLTTGAALLSLGEDYVFRTRVDLVGDRLVIVGSGDPALGDPDILDTGPTPMTPDDLLARVAQAIADRGVTAVAGITVDDRTFDRQFLHPMWDADDVVNAYGAPVAGLSFNRNVLTVFAEPGAIGGEPEVSTTPRAPWVDVENTGKTVAQGRNTLWVAREAEANRFTVRGDVRFAAAAEAPLHAPPAFVGMLFAQALVERSVAVGPVARPIDIDERALAGVVRLAEPDDVLTDGVPLAIVTTRLTDVLRRCNVVSQNLYAESLFKLLGHKNTGEPGSWENGAAVLRMMLAERLQSGEIIGVRLSDGSGLSRGNQLAPIVMARWLASLGSDPKVGPVFASTLPTIGEGTLRNRFEARRPRFTLRAKSGFLSGVYTLSGYLVDERGTPAVAFSIFCNDVDYGSGAAARKLHENAVLAMDKWLTANWAPAAPVATGG